MSPLCVSWVKLPHTHTPSGWPPPTHTSTTNATRYADLSRLPPALFTVGTSDPLLDDSLFMAARYGAAGCKVKLAVYAGGQHGIGHFGAHEDTELGREARQHTLEFLGRHMCNSGSFRSGLLDSSTSLA